ncbi:MAG: hypothetical protein R3B47_10800 [Bacteroidia bacterium]
MIQARSENGELRQRVEELEQQDLALRERILGVKEGGRCAKKPDSLKVLGASPNQPQQRYWPISADKKPNAAYAEAIGILIQNERKAHAHACDQACERRILAFLAAAFTH